MELIDIGTIELTVCVLLVVVAGAASMMLRLSLTGIAIWATARMVAQLFLLAYILRFIFGLQNPALVLAVLAVMIVFAAWTIYSRVNRKQVPIFRPVFLTMLLSYTLMTAFACGVIVRVEPWYDARYFIPIGGMIVGNSMNAIAVALDRLLASLKNDRQRVELCLSLGATAREASHDAVRDAVRAGMIPTINSMLTIGVVFIPGMMTGQILAGADPVVAIKYQIMIMVMIFLATSAGAVAVTLLVSRKCFTAAQQLKAME